MMSVTNSSGIVHIAYAFEDTYTEYAIVSMTSILHNTKSHVHFHVLENRLSTMCKKNVERIKEMYPHGTWSFYQVGHSENFILYDKTIKVETYFRLFLPSVLSDLDRVLWIDADTVIDADITDLYYFPMGDNYAAAVADHYWGDKVKHHSAIGINRQCIYFNAGVLLLNIKEINASGALDNAFYLIPSLFNKCMSKKEPFMQDQDILNFVLQERVVILPLKYNVMYVYERSNFGGSTSLVECVEAFIAPVIIHYQGHIVKKIAELGNELILSPLWEKYYFYKQYTHFADPENDKIKMTRYRKKLDTMADGIITTYQMFAAKRFDIISDLFNKIKDLVNGKKLVVWGYNEHTWLLITILATKGLIVNDVVDGLIGNQFEKVFGYIVKEPKMVLEGNGDSHFILINTGTRQTANRIKDIARSYGIKEQASYYVYEDLWKLIEGDGGASPLVPIKECQSTDKGSKDNGK